MDSNARTRPDHNLSDWWSALGIWSALLGSACTPDQAREAAEMIALCSAEIATLIAQISAMAQWN